MTPFVFSNLTGSTLTLPTVTDDQTISTAEAIGVRNSTFRMQRGAVRLYLDRCSNCTVVLDTVPTVGVFINKSVNVKVVVPQLNASGGTVDVANSQLCSVTVEARLHESFTLNVYDSNNVKLLVNDTDVSAEWLYSTWEA